MAESGKISEAEARQIVGAGAKTPPPFQEDYASSVGEGTMSRGSYVPSPTRPRGYNRPVVNDDGTPIMEDTNALLVEIRDLLKTLVEK